jgi:RNAse (barnase) inhibitor barstar
MELSRQSVGRISPSFGQLLIPGAPWVFNAVYDSNELTSALVDWQKEHPRLRLYILDGSRMRTADGFYSEFKSKLALPEHLGRNLNALSECLTDAGILAGDAFVVLVNNGSQLLADEDSEMINGFLDILNTVGEEWSNAVHEGQDWDRVAVPFHSIIQLDQRLVTLATLPSCGL